jgi:hypothetical protein
MKEIRQLVMERLGLWLKLQSFSLVHGVNKMLSYS